MQWLTGRSNTKTANKQTNSHENAEEGYRMTPRNIFKTENETENPTNAKVEAISEQMETVVMMVEDVNGGGGQTATVGADVSMSGMENGEPNKDPDETMQEQKRRVSQGVQELLWEKQQLQEINLRVDNIFNVFGAQLGQKGDRVITTPDKELLNQWHDAQTKAMKDLEEQFLAKVQAKGEELSDAKAQLQSAIDKCAELERELKDQQSRNDQLKKENANLKNEKNQAYREKEKGLADAQSLKDICEAQMQKMQENQPVYPGVSRSDIEEELSAAFAEKLTNILQERDDRYNELKEQTEEIFQKKLEENEKQIQELTSFVDAQKRELANFQNDLLKSTQERDFAKKELEIEKELRKAVEEESGKQKEQLENQLKEAEDRCNQLQSDYRVMCDEHFTLEKMNIDLRAEIEDLKQKLDNFEAQHKIESPVHSRKRRRTDSSLMESRVLKSVQGPIIEAQATFPLECITRQYEGDWIGFELQNQWNKPIVLKGWSLSNTDQTLRLPLPEKRLNPKEIIRVCLTEDKHEPNDLVWEGVHLQKGDRHDLWVDDSLGFRHKLTTISPPSTNGDFRPDSCFIM